MGKRKKERALGHDPFAEMGTFDIEGPVPAAEQSPPAPEPKPVPQLKQESAQKRVNKVEKPTFKAPIFTTKSAPANVTTADNSRAFSIADFLSSANKKPAAATEPIEEVKPTAEPTGSEIDQPELAAAPSIEESEESEESKESKESEELEETSETEETKETESNALPEPTLSIKTAETDETDGADNAEDADDTGMLEVVQEATPEEYDDDDALDAPFLLVDPADGNETKEETAFMEEGQADAPLDTQTAALEEQVVPSESELQALLDTAELALAEEHLAALEQLETRAKPEETEPPEDGLDNVADVISAEEEPALDDAIKELERPESWNDEIDGSIDTPLFPEDEQTPNDATELETPALWDDEIDRSTDAPLSADEQTNDTIIDEDGPIWGATAPLEPDLGMSWETDEEETAESLPSWLTADVSTLKLDTGMLRPIVLGEEEEMSEPDLHLDWEEDAEEEALPEWLTAETSASRIDTDKLHPLNAEEAHDEPDVMEPAAEGEMVDERIKDEQPESGSEEPPTPADLAWLENSDDHLWQTTTLSPLDAEPNMAETRAAPVLPELAEGDEDQQAESIDAPPQMPQWMKAHLQDSGKGTRPLTALPEPVADADLSPDELPFDDSAAVGPSSDSAREDLSDLWDDFEADDPVEDAVEDAVDTAAFDWSFSGEADEANEEESEAEFADIAPPQESVSEPADPFDSFFEEELDNPSQPAEDTYTGKTAVSDEPADAETNTPPSLSWPSRNQAEVLPPAEELAPEQLPEWLKTEESFTLFPDDAEEDALLLAEDLDEETTPLPVEPAFRETDEVADEDLEFLDDEETFGFDFDFYDVETAETAETRDEEINVEFDDTAFDLGNLTETAKPTSNAVDLDDLLSKYSNLPATQMLSLPDSYVEPIEIEAESIEDSLDGVINDDNLLFDFDFDQVGAPAADPAEPFSLDAIDPFSSFETEDLQDDEDIDIDVDALLARYASPAETPPLVPELAEPDANRAPPVNTDLDPLSQLLQLIDSEMEPLFEEVQTAVQPPEPAPAPAPTTLAKPEPLPTTFPVAEETADTEPTLEEYVVFKIAMSSYAISLDNVQEITPAPQTTYVPNVPSWVLGVSNLHGEIFSVVDFRRFLKLPWIEAIPEQRMLAVHDSRQEIRTGLLVDGVTAIKKLHPTDVKPLDAELGEVTEAARPYAIGRYENVTVLDLNTLLMSSEMRQFELARS